MNFYSVPLDLTSANKTDVLSLELLMPSALTKNQGYIVGTGDGIVTINGLPARREILCMEANSKEYQFVARVWSLDNGHYIFTGLDPHKEYLVIARDYKKEYEPFAYDHLKPATDLTMQEQQALLQAWQ